MLLILFPARPVDGRRIVPLEPLAPSPAELAIEALARIRFLASGYMVWQEVGRLYKVSPSVITKARVVSMRATQAEKENLRNGRLTSEKVYLRVRKPMARA